MVHLEHGEVSHLRTVISGKVQGVGFRYFLMRKATTLGLVGYVQNAGSYDEVEIVAEGYFTHLESFLGAVRRGPPGARVDHLTSNWDKPTGHYKTFSVNHT